MTAYEDKVRAFHEAFGITLDAPMTAELLAFRKRLIGEEIKELYDEIDRAAEELRAQGHVSRKTLADLMKELADVQYVLSGTVVTFGLPADEVYDRVHESNMSKLGEDGKPVRREDGKVMKGPRYHPPHLGDLADAVVELQGEGQQDEKAKHAV
jgi:predicted HAD superfamily Cof-like phosphohydrolase